MVRNSLTALFLTVAAGTSAQSTGHYAEINGIKLYYEIHGNGSPLVVLHGGGSTIESNYGQMLPLLSDSHKVIAVELQAHGHTTDRDKPLSFEQDADDVAALLKKLSIDKADIMGFSNGGTTALQLAIRHPESVNKLILASAIYSREGMPAGFFEYIKNAKFEDMPQPLKDAYLKARPGDTKGLLTMFNRDVERMNGFKDISGEVIKKIKSPALILNGDKDVVQVSHAIKLAQLLPNARLAILPSAHSDYVGEICATDKSSKIPEATATLIKEFLK